MSLFLTGLILLITYLGSIVMVMGIVGLCWQRQWSNALIGVAGLIVFNLICIGFMWAVRGVQMLFGG